MASVSGPPVPRHPSPFMARPAHQQQQPPVSRSTAPSAASNRPSSSSRHADPYYGHEVVAKLCARYVNNLFHCPDTPPPSASSQPPPALANFIAYALHRTRLHQAVTFAALYLLQRLKTRFVAARGSSGHRLFISAFMIASKVICDDTYSNKSWCIVGQGMFALREINQMEREMCSYLEWQLNVDPAALKEFEATVRRDYKGPGPYPQNYTLPAPATGPFAHPKPTTNPIGTAIPMFGPSSQTTPSSSPPKTSAMPHKPSHSPERPMPTRQSSGDTYPSPPGSPGTPSSSHSNSVSPAASMSPVTPPNYDDYNAKIVSSTGSNTMQISSDNISPPRYHSIPRKSSSPMITSHHKSHSADVKHTSPAKTTTPAPHQHVPAVKPNTVYAYARPCVW